MTPESDHEKQLEHAIHRVLRELPERRAPRTLEQRVAAELARRAALPWWKKSFAHWPWAARVLFLLSSAAVVKLLLSATLWAMAGFEVAQLREAFATPLALLDAIQTAGGAIVGACEIVLRSIPALWLYTALVVIAALYATLFGLGAAAYKTLVAPR